MAWKIKKNEPEEVKEEKPVLPSFKKKEKTVIVKELPLRPVREYQEEDGTVVHLMTIEEALTEMYN